MKNTERAEAQELYFQSNMSKTDISNRLNVSRRTVTLWAHQGNWDTLRRSARIMPALVAEKCYHLIDQYTSALLTDQVTSGAINIKHAQTIHLLASSIKKLKNRSTVNESMEMFNFFLEGLSRRDPELAAQVLPQVEEFISCRSSATTNCHLTDDFNADGNIPFPEKEITEQYADEKDAADLNEEFDIFIQQRDEARLVARQQESTLVSNAENTRLPNGSTLPNNIGPTTDTTSEPTDKNTSYS
jgi:hypothetical protein